MSGRLAGRVAIVTGGGQGIGAAITQRFCEAGASVVIAQRNAAVGEAHAAALRAAGHTALSIPTDIAEREQVDALVERTVEAIGPPDVLVNNAGIGIYRDPLTMTDDDWRRCFAVDLDGAWFATRAVLPHMLARGRGS